MLSLNLFFLTQASIADIEQKLQISQATLQERNVFAEERKHLAEQYQHQVTAYEPPNTLNQKAYMFEIAEIKGFIWQVAELKVEITELKIKLKNVLQETCDTKEGRDAEIIQVVYTVLKLLGKLS